MQVGILPNVVGLGEHPNPAAPYVLNNANMKIQRHHIRYENAVISPKE